MNKLFLSLVFALTMSTLTLCKFEVLSFKKCSGTVFKHYYRYKKGPHCVTVKYNGKTINFDRTASLPVSSPPAVTLKKLAKTKYKPNKFNFILFQYTSHPYIHERLDMGRSKKAYFLEVVEGDSWDSNRFTLAQAK